MSLTQWDNDLHQQQDYKEGHEELVNCLVEADHKVEDGEEDGWLHNEQREIHQLEEKVGVKIVKIRPHWSNSNSEHRNRVTT